MEMIDYSQSIPQLHLLYAKWAVVHLIVIDRQIKELSDFGNVHLSEIIEGMLKERKALVINNKAYTDANEIIESIWKGVSCP